jgi:hypothetical protein
MHAATPHPCGEGLVCKVRPHRLVGDAGRNFQRARSFVSHGRNCLERPFDQRATGKQTGRRMGDHPAIRVHQDARFIAGVPTRSPRRGCPSAFSRLRVVREPTLRPCLPHRRRQAARSSSPLRFRHHTSVATFRPPPPPANPHPSSASATPTPSARAWSEKYPAATHPP